MSNPTNRIVTSQVKSELIQEEEISRKRVITTKLRVELEENGEMLISINHEADGAFIYIPVETFKDWLHSLSLIKV